MTYWPHTEAQRRYRARQRGETGPHLALRPRGGYNRWKMAPPGERLDLEQLLDMTAAEIVRVFGMAPPGVGPEGGRELRQIVTWIDEYFDRNCE